MKQAVLVTGAGRRVGLHMAKRLLESGYQVLAHYRSRTDGIDELEALGVATIQADLQDKATILDFVSALRSRAETYRALIHNASAFMPTEASLADAADQYVQFFTVHMLAPYLISEGLAEQMQGAGDEPADIINITDINVENPTVKFDIYGTTKAGLHNMTVVLAKKLAPAIKVNAVAPGPVLFTESHSEEARQSMLAETPLAREGGPEPVFQAVKSLLENPYITGASIPVDGGRRLSKP